LTALPGGAWLIDTPGIRELGWLASETSLDLGFPEIALLAECRFAVCPGMSKSRSARFDRLSKKAGFLLAGW
jgi:putative ribosome biogenesis GTPase RsgA